MSFYPAASLNPDFPAIRITGGPAFEAEVARILQHIQIGARSRVGAFIVDSILLNGDRREGLHILNPHHALHDALTSARGAVRNSDQPNSTRADFLAHPGRGAGATLRYYPYEWGPFGAGQPGTSRDEILLHELVHVYMMQRGLSSFRRLNRPRFATRVRPFDELDDFYAVMITNVYASECGRLSRRDHHGFAALGRNAVSIASDPRFRPLFAALEAHAQALVTMLRGIDTPFNPWHARLALIDATAVFDDP